MEYLLLASKTDTPVEAAELEMLHHTFDQDPESPLRLERFYEAFIAIIIFLQKLHKLKKFKIKS